LCWKKVKKKTATVETINRLDDQALKGDQTYLGYLRKCADSISKPVIHPRNLPETSYDSGGVDLYDISSSNETPVLAWSSVPTRLKRLLNGRVEIWL
jgi:hypothetical protein